MDIEFYKVKEETTYLFLEKEEYEKLKKEKDFENLLKETKFEKRTNKEIEEILKTKEFIVFKDTKETKADFLVEKLRNLGINFFILNE